MAPHPDLAPHQLKALRKLKNGSILWGGVGTGKTRVALAYYVDKEFLPPVPGSDTGHLIVITTAKKRDSLDWEDEAARFGIGKEIGATLMGPMVVDSWNNIHKYVDRKNCFFIFDEQRLVGKGKWSKSFLKIAKSNEWILLSATPGDTWLDYIPVFIANGFYRNRSEFHKQHVILKPYMSYPVVDRYVEVGTLIRLRNSILVEMPYERQTRRKSINVWTDYSVEAMASVNIHRWNPIENRPFVNAAEMFYFMRRVVNADPSRVQEVLQLFEKHRRLIVFYNFNYELDLLRDALGEYFSGLIKDFPHEFKGGYAEWNGHKHEPIPETPEWIYLVQYMAGAEGWNCITTDAMCFYSLPYSYKMWEQAHGRIDRFNTPYTDLFYYVLRSKAPIDWAIWRSLSAKKSFQNADYDIGNTQFAEIQVQKSAKTAPEQVLEMDDLEKKWALSKGGVIIPEERK